MTAVMAVIKFVQRVPEWAWGVVALSGIVYTITMAGRSYIAGVRSDARAQTLAEGAAVDDVVLRWQREIYLRQLDSVRAVADRLRDSVQVEVRTVKRWAPLIPDSLRRIPAVDSFVRACTRLARDCDSLRVTTARVDTLVDTLRVVDETRVKSMQLAIISRDDRIKILESRTCTVQTTAGGVIAGALGYLIGRRK